MIRVVVVEDSASQRAHLVRALEAEGDIAVVALATDATAALGVVQEHRPEVVTVDLQLPGGGGRHAIEQIMAFAPTPILVLSATVTGPHSEAAVNALVSGALDAVPKPARWTAAAEAELRKRVRSLRGATVLRHPRGRRSADAGEPRRTRTVPVVAVAASTGGPPALAKLLAGLGGLRAAVLVVQHLHPDFIDGFVTWMARVSPLPVQPATDRAPLQAGAVYIAPGNAHLKVKDGRLMLDPEPRTLHRPSANELFKSVATSSGRRAVGVLLTGMGDDGATGLLAMRTAGAHTIAQDERSSAVYGMPRVAKAVGAAVEVLPLDAVAEAVKRSMKRVTG
ncbi:MAG TPA: chemotaxis protein CheB [Acidimicrobiales bacterium]|nr:chemotaxis protein CheB [Acidimicrobiales bacterium]